MSEQLTEYVLQPVSPFAVMQFLAAFALSSLRFAVVIVFMPIFAEFRIPMSTRYIAALALSLPVLPTLDVTIVHGGMAAWQWFLLTCKELVIGLVLLLILSLPFWVVDFAGDVLELQRGMGNEVATDPNDLIQSQPTGRVLFLIFMLFILTSGGFLIIFDIFYKSFLIFPVMSVPDIGSFLEKFMKLHLFDSIFYYAMLVLLPALILLLLADVTIALLTRFAQQLNALQLLLVLKGLLLVAMLPFYGPGLSAFVEPLLEDMALHMKMLAP